MKRLEKPIFRKKMIKDMEDMSFFTSALIFDDLLIVSQKETCCFVLKTTEGLILIDAIWPCEQAFASIVKAVEDVGWDPETFKKLVLTHGHVDHTGCGRWFVERYGVETYLSRTDDIFWEEHPTKPDRPETWKDYTIDYYLKDDDRIVLGNKQIYVCETPGHTPGCLSYIFPVCENGKIHMAGLFGGATPPWNGEGVDQYLDSLNHFMKVAEDQNVDVALCNHTAIDNGLERIAYSKARLGYMPNIYIIGQDGFVNFCKVFRTMSGLD